MDGSYEVHIDMLENQQCKMDFIEGGAEKVIL